MAMISCKECGNKISQTAEKCPKCGEKTDYQKKEDLDEAIIAMIMLIFSIIAGVWAFFSIDWSL